MICAYLQNLCTVMPCRGPVSLGKTDGQTVQRGGVMCNVECGSKSWA